jgi:hypothetical protein
MDAIELRRRGVELLSPVLVPYGFVYQAAKSIAAAADSMPMAARTSEPFAGIQRAPCAR